MDMKETVGGNAYVLRPEEAAEDDEITLNNVEQQERIARDADEWSGEQDRKQQPAHISAGAIKPTVRSAWVQPQAMSLLVRRGQVITKIRRILDCCVHFNSCSQQCASISYLAPNRGLRTKGLC